MRFIFFILVIFLQTSSCKEEKKPSENDNRIIKIFIYRSGVITANGNRILINDLATYMAKNKFETAYYSREDIYGEPASNYSDVLDLIVKNNLTVQFYTDETFTKLFNPLENK